MRTGRSYFGRISSQKTAGRPSVPILFLFFFFSIAASSAYEASAQTGDEKPVPLAEASGQNGSPPTQTPKTGAGTAGPASSVEFSSSGWNFGSIASGKPVSREFSVTNLGRQEFSVMLMSTCDCITVRKPASRKLKSGERTVFVISLDPSGESGRVEWDLIIRTSLPELPKAFYHIEGTVTHPE